MSTTLLLLSAGVLAVSVIVLKAGSMKQLRAELVGYRLQFPTRLDGDAVVGFLGGLSGLLLPWWRRWLVTPFVVAQVHADAGGITHTLLVPRGWSVLVENLLQAHLPGVRYTPVELQESASRLAAEFRLSSGRRLLRIDPAILSQRLLTSLQPLHAGEEIIVQWIISAAGPVVPAHTATAAEQRSPSALRSRAALSAEEATALRQKQSQPLLLATGRIGVTARSVGRQRSLLRQVESTWHSSRAPGVELRRRTFDERQVAARLRACKVPLLLWPGIFNSEELAGLVGWPIDVEQIPGLVLGGCRPLAPSPLLRSIGTVIGEANFPGSQRPVALEVGGRLRHMHVLGPTGTGKSTLLQHLIESDLAAGHGVVVVDPKGDLVSAVLARVPADRQRDVIVLDPADEAAAVGLNPLRSATGARSEVAVENLVGLLKSLYRSSWGPRTDDILRAALLTLASSGQATLCEVPALLTDPRYRRRLVGRLDDDPVLEFWGWYEGLSDPERLSVVGPVLNKVRAFTMRSRVRAIIGQADPALNLDDVLAKRQVLLVSLASGLLGEEAAALLGALVFAELWHATTARVGIPERARRPVMAHLDEWQHFLHLPTPMPAMLAEARGLRLGLTLAHQHLGQLPNDVRDAVLANARSRVVFQLPSGDARLLAHELGAGLTPEDLQTLGAFEVVAKLFAAGRSQPPVTLSTYPASPPSSDADQLRGRSRERYGVAPREVEVAIRRRQQAPGADAPIGRRRRGGSIGGRS